jgi:hypothetical protein
MQSRRSREVQPVISAQAIDSTSLVIQSHAPRLQHYLAYGPPFLDRAAGEPHLVHWKPAADINFQLAVEH